MANKVKYGVFEAKQEVMSVDYHITLTLKPSMYRMDAEEQFRKTKDIVRNLMRGFTYTCVTELTNQYNIHYHMICKAPLAIAKCIPKLFADRKRKIKELGFHKMDSVDNYDVYTAYMLKDVKKTQEILGHYPVINDDYMLNIIKVDGYIVKPLQKEV